MTAKDESKVEATLSAILRLLAVQAVEGKSTTDAVLLLDQVRLDRDVIADVCGTSRNSVYALLSQARSREKAQAAKPKRKKAE